MPVAGINRLKSPGRIIPSQPGFDMGIGEKILAVVVSNELVSDCLAKNERHNHRQQEADAGCRAFLQLAGGHWLTG